MANGSENVNSNGAGIKPGQIIAAAITGSFGIAAAAITIMSGMLTEHGEEIVALRTDLTGLRKEMVQKTVDRYKSTDADRDFRLRDYRIEQCELFIRGHRQSTNGDGHKK